MQPATDFTAQGCSATTAHEVLTHVPAALAAGNAALEVTNAGTGSNPIAISIVAGDTTGVSTPTDLTLNSLTIGAGGLTVRNLVHWSACRICWICRTCKVPGDAAEPAAHCTAELN